MTTSVLERIGLTGIVPVVVLQHEEDALPLAGALLAGGLSTMEITFRTAAAPGALARIARECPQMLPGAGTVLSIDQVKAAVGAGARYVVAPGLSARVVEYCRTNGIPVIPGVATPTEIATALEMGVETLKFFPAEACGGLDYLKAVSAPFLRARFIPTGGIDESNMVAYLKFPRVVACGGSWMVRSDLVAARKFDEVTRLTAQAVSAMLGLQVVSPGQDRTGAGEPPEAGMAAEAVSRLLGVTVAVGGSAGQEWSGSGTSPSSAPAGAAGAAGMGRPAILGTNFPDRAAAFFALRGIPVREASKVERNGTLAACSLEKEVGGFAVRLVQLGS